MAAAGVSNDDGVGTLVVSGMMSVSLLLFAVGFAPPHEAGDDVILRVEVTDTGIGIAPAAQAALFEPFSQADSSTTCSFGGTGLGLAICSRLVELMGGKLELESDLGRGSTLSFTPRLGKQDEPAVPGPKRPDLVGVRALIVDDNATNRKILEGQTASWGMSSQSAGGGPEALQMLCHAHAGGTPYEIGLIEMDMPEMDGIAVARAIRGDRSLTALPLVLLTSSAGRGSATQAREAGFSIWLMKAGAPILSI